MYGQYSPQIQDYDTQEKVANFDSLMAMIKTKIQETDDARTKIHLLTLAPNSWPISKLKEYFQVRLKVELVIIFRRLVDAFLFPFTHFILKMYIYIEIKTRLEFSLQKSLQHHLAFTYR